MKTPPQKNTLVDEANGITYVIHSTQPLTDGEMYQAVRLALLARGRKLPAKGETLEITWKK